MKTRQELKIQLVTAVAVKRAATRERIEFKAQNRGPSPSDRTWAHWRDCRIAKEEARLVGLAYAFARGRRYWHAERFTKSPPNARSIAFIADVDTAAVEAWLAETPTVAELGLWQAFVRSTRAKEFAEKMARRAARKAA